MTTEQQKQVQSFRLSALTVRQLDWLTEQWGTSKTEALTLLVDRVYQRERTLAVDLLAAGVDGGMVE
jgi:hypothetical protein